MNADLGIVQVVLQGAWNTASVPSHGVTHRMLPVKCRIILTKYRDICQQKNMKHLQSQ